MSNVPPQGSPGVTPLYTGPNAPRRSSYASVAAGASSNNQQTASVHLPPAPNRSVYPQPQNSQLSRIPRPTSTETEMPAEESTRLPETWGSGTRDAFPIFRSSLFSSSTLSKFANNPWELMLAGLGDDGHFKPTYLRGSRYMDQIESAHKEKLEAKEEEKPTRSRNASLSKGSSNVSVPKMQHSHRGMAYEIIEHIPTVTETGPGRLPSRWAHADKYNCVEIAGDGQQVRYVGTSKLQDLEAAAARTDRPMPVQAGIYYYEVTIISKGRDGMIGVGFSSKKVSLEKLPGWEPDSWAYHGDDGKTFCCQIAGKPFGPTFSSEDTIGCGVNFMNGTAFFTKNGHFLGSAFREIHNTELYPSVGMKRPHAHLVANFGQRSFVFDIDSYVERKKQEIRNEMNASDVSSLHPALNRDDLCKALVAQYLSHDGYIETAQAFSEEVRRDNTALTGVPESSINAFLAVENDRNAAYRQQVRAAVLEGDIDKTLYLTNTYFPRVLSTNHEINFRVRCCKYVEMMRECAEHHLDTPTSPSKTSQLLNGTSGAPQQAMDLDDSLAEDGLDLMETSGTSTGRSISYDDMINHIITYGRELHTEFSEEPDLKLRESFQETMKELFGMLAYKDPRQSPAARFLESSERVKVAEGLNSAILVSLGKSPSTALERMYKQTVVFTDMISEDGGPGCVINVRNILRPRKGLPSSTVNVR